MAKTMRISCGLAGRLALVVIALAAFALLSPGRADAATVDVDAADIYFCDSSYYFGVCPTTVAVGDTVAWHFTGYLHSVTECGGVSCDDAPPPVPVFNSGIVSGGTYSYMFNTPGVYLYQCGIHGSGMRGQITVVASVGGVAELPDTDPNAVTQAAPGGSNWTFAWLGLASFLATIGLGTGAAWYARRKTPS